MNKIKVYEILSSVLNITIEEIMAYDILEPLENIGLNSLGFIKVIVQLEEAFEIEIRDSDLLMSNFTNIKSIFCMLKKYFREEGDALKKVIITDCDNVLWRGVAGEEDLILDEICIKYQNKLVELSKKGALVCLCSKNDAHNTNDAFLKLPMILQKNNIVIEKINWQDKAINIKSISNKLNLSLDSFVFIDDSDYELGLVASLIPEITVLKANSDDGTWIESLELLFSETNSRLDRTQQYLIQKEREKEHIHFNSVEEYNLSLETKIQCEVACVEQISRIVEMSIRTNQFNLASTRYNEQDVLSLIHNNEYRVIVASISDKYGDMGIVGCAVVQLMQHKIESFMISCRAFDRGVEYIMLEQIKSILNSEKIYGVYIPNKKNSRFENFYSLNRIVTIYS